MTDAKGRSGFQPTSTLAPAEGELSASTSADDLWLDMDTDPELSGNDRVRTVFRDSVSLPAMWIRRGAVFFSTTIGLMTLLAAVLTVAIIAAGGSMAQAAQHRQSAMKELINNTEPMTAATQDLFTSLSLADTAATTGFVQAGVEEPSNRERYQRAIQRASSAATQSASGVSGTGSRELELIGEIQSQLPVYTGLVETARTNNRSGNPVGVAYMSEASALMRNSMLPAAKELLDLTTASLNQQQGELTRPNWIPMSGLLAALIMLIGAQRWLAHKTRRRLNKGLLTATVFMTIALLWVATSNALTWHAGNKGFQEAAAPLNSLANARVLAQQARTAETLALVRRETTEDSFEEFATTNDRIKQAIEQYEKSDLSKKPENAQTATNVHTALDDWAQAHEALASSLNNGDYNTALRIAFPSKNGKQQEDTGTASRAYDDVDAGLSTLMVDARGSLRAFLHDGLSPTRLLSTIVMLLSILSVVALWLGIRPRLQEYL